MHPSRLACASPPPFSGSPIAAGLLAAQRRSGRSPAELRAPDRPALRRLPHHRPRADAVRAPLQDRRLHDARRRLARAPAHGDVHRRLHSHERGQDAPPAPGLHTNDNLVSQQVSGFIAGKLIGNVGSFIQITGNPASGAANNVFVDASDVRYADTLKLFGQDTIWGIDVNNTPTVEDPWNTTPSFGWPQISSTIAPAFAPPLTHVESGYGQIVGGAGAYVFWNDMLYADLTLYKGLPVPVLQAFNDGNSTTDALSNVAPYWRVALEPHWGQHYLMVGTFGMYGQITPGRQYGFGTDNFLDVGFDSQYQYDGDQYSVTVKLTDILEWQKLNATYGLGGSSNINNTLNSFKANASFVWDHTYSIGFGYFNITGSSDCNMYGSAARAVSFKWVGRVRRTASKPAQRRRADPRPRLYPVRSRRAGSLRLHDLECAHRHSVHRVSASLRRLEQFRRLVSGRHA